jgi:hypothetical protein
MPKTLPALLPALLLALLVGACFKPDETRATSWTKPGATQDDIYADITSCRQQARAIIERDASIDADIASGASGNDFGTTASDLEYNLDAYSADKRQRRLVAECMHGRGYALAGDG